MAAMTCREFKDELLLYFGSDNLPDDLQRHLDECASCREEYEAMESMSLELGTDTDFFPDDITAEILARQVESRLEPSVAEPVTGPSWYSLAGLAASILLVAGISFFGNFFKSLPVYEDGSQTSRFEKEMIASSNSDLAPVLDESLYEMSDGEFDILVNDYVAGRSYEAAGQLLDDISEEELRYLEENLNVGDLL